MKRTNPALEQAGWDLKTQVRREVSFTDGRVIVRGKVHTRAKRKRADYLLFYEANLPLAVIEAKDNRQAVGAGMQQAQDYATTLDIPFVFSSNGDGFLFFDATGTSEQPEVLLSMDAFPSPAELWRRYREWKGLTDETEKLARFPYYEEASDNAKEPRYYQRIAIQRTIEAVARVDELMSLLDGLEARLTADQNAHAAFAAAAVHHLEA